MSHACWQKGISAIEKSSISLTLILLDSGVGVMVKDRVRAKWFRVYDPDGRLLGAASDTVSILRSAQPEINTAAYNAGESNAVLGHADEGEGTPKFSLESYVERCFARFNDVRYAPLAALGFRFSNTTLTDIYVPATANLSRDSRSDEALERAVKEFLESTNLDAAQRDQLERQMRASHGLSGGAEVSAAQVLYQKHGNVVVTGDPGSGKTCFVKREILAYCHKEGGSDGWYGQHIPVFVPLVEAARFLSDVEDLLSTCSTVAARSGLNLPRRTIEEYLSKGRVAFFFDGLDEISSLDDRIRVLSSVRELVERFSKLGNRFVLTSRPAALRPVDVPKGLSHLKLTGLTEGEIRVLAKRVITFRLVEGAAAEESGAQELVDRLIEDCRDIPGIGRLARNPLLLTILVLVYANSGTLYARRHVVYTQAVKTLVSVRNRPLKMKVLSESDLRKRLGALALAIYEHKIAEIPSRSEVVSVLSQFIAKGVGDPASRANEFLREVAEETGLLVIHGRKDDQDVITFMHHSFLEYYSAVGVLDADRLNELSELSKSSHWQEVITLMFGILSEQRDVTPWVNAILAETSEADAVTQRKLIFAFDCALECDVPPEATQELLAQKVKDVVESGPARVALSLRLDLGLRIGQMYAAAGGGKLTDVLTTGMRHENPSIAAAYVDLVSHMNEDVRFDVGVSAFEEAFARQETSIQLTCLSALRSRPEFRTEGAAAAVRRALSGSLVEKFAALRTVESVGGFIEKMWPDVVTLLDDRNAVIATAAASCLVTSGVFEHKGTENRELLERALRSWRRTAEAPQRTAGSYKANKAAISEMLASGDVASVEGAVRYLVLLQKEEGYVYETTMSTLRASDDHRIRTACLETLRSVPEAIALVTLADTDFLCSLINADQRDVRIATAKVLRELSRDEQVYEALEARAQKARASGDEEEFSEVMESVACHTGPEEFARNRLRGLLDEMESGFGEDVTQRMHLHALRVIGELDVLLPYSATRGLQRVWRDYRAPRRLRLEAIRAFGALTEPSVEAIRELRKEIKSFDGAFRAAAYEASADIVVSCKKKTDFVRAAYDELREFLPELVARWRKDSPIVRDRIDDRPLANLRRAIMEIESILDSYDEYSEHMASFTPRPS